MLGVAIVGAGRIGIKRAEAIEGSAARLRVVADTDPAKARSLAERFRCEWTTEWRQTIARSDVGIVIVATPHADHFPIGMAAIEQGKHLLCEKPLGTLVREAEQLLVAAHQHGVTLKTGFNHRHHPAIQRAKAIVTRGGIGEPMFIRGRYGHGGRIGYEQEWRTNPAKAGGGELLDQGVHLLDLCRWFLGDFHEVFGLVATYYWNVHPLEDNVFALLRTPKGQTASLHASWTQWINLFSFEVYGTHGYLEVHGLGGSYGSERLVWGHDVGQNSPPVQERFEFAEDTSWKEEWRETLLAIQERREPIGSGRDGWLAMKLAHAVYESAHDRQIKECR